MIIATHGILANSSIPFVGLLDTYSGATCAYSLRKLRSAYSGYAIRVRRSSDNATQDIGFTNGNLDTTSLLSFTGSNSGYVSIWYDQSGNGYNLTQTTSANQPRIVNLGSLEIYNSKNSILFSYDLNAQFLNATLSLGDKFSIFSTHSDTIQNSFGSIHKPILASSTDTFLDNSTSYRISKLRESSNGVYYGIPNTGLEANNSLLVNYTKTNTLELLYGENDSATFKFYKNNTQIGTTVTGNNRSSGFNTSYQIGASENGTNYRYYRGNICEIIIYDSNQSSNKTGISNNINSYYSIY